VTFSKTRCRMQSQSTNHSQSYIWQKICTFFDQSFWQKTTNQQTKEKA